MKYFDVFNGDADGLCSLHQLRLAEPREAIRITGAKRDIALLERVNAVSGDSVTVLDISADANHVALSALLARGVTVDYFDHHGSGEVPMHAGLHARIDITPDVCTGIIVDRYLRGAQRPWAVVAAFGDNLVGAAEKLATSLRLDRAQLDALHELGDCLNYNGYGDTEQDLIVHPDTLYSVLHCHQDPFEFIRIEPLFAKIRTARCEDLERTGQEIPDYILPNGEIYLLPDAAWSRRVRGTFGNMLATRDPERAHAVLTPATAGAYTVSVRAPLATLSGARQLCQQFTGGGGRAAAGGINGLPAAQLPAFIHAFGEAFGSDSSNC